MTGARAVLIVLAGLMAVLVAGIGLSGSADAGADAADGDELVLPARVVSIVDGDTLKVRLTGQVMTVRLHGVDAPESNQAHGRAAAKALQALAANREVELKPVGQDQYDRMVARVYVDGDDVNGRMVAQGYAWAYRRFLRQEPGALSYCDLEADARAAGRGLWVGPARDWVPPWDFRRRHRADDGAGSDHGSDQGRDYGRETAAACRATAAGREVRNVSPSPAACAIKGNINSRGERIYHVPGSPSYRSTRIDPGKGERWFCSAAEARAAGWRAPR